MSFFMGSGGYWRLVYAGFDMIRNLHVFYRLEAKCSVLSYKTPLGTELNGSERKTPCDEENTCISTCHDVEKEGGLGGAFFFSSPNCT